MTIHSLPYEIPYCSSWDEDHSPEELVAYSPGNRSGLEDDSIDFDETDELPNSSKVKGWQTPKCPNYPQDLIVHLLCGPARIAKVQVLSHHYKIATKIDIYIGVAKEPTEIPVEFDEPVGDDEDDMVVEFTRLGYVCLDSNTRAQFRARELKSIKVNADGEYVRLVIRNCHQNRLNTYNQVGLLALNILGQPLHPNSASLSAIPSHMARHLHHPLDESSLLSTSTRRTSVSSSQSLVNRIAASGAVEIELQQWISAIAHAEEDAVKGESYQLAKTFKELSDKLSRFAKIVYDLEVGKKQAADAKDYDEAERIKADICVVKQKAEMLLKEAGVRVTRDGQVVALGSEEYDDFADDQSRILPDSLLYNDQNGRDRYEPEDSTLVSGYEHQHNVESVEEQQDRLYDEAIEKWTNFDAQHAVPSAEEEVGLVQNGSSSSQQDTSSPRSSVSTDAAEMLLPPHLTSYTHNNISPLLGRDMTNDKDFRRESLASILAPSLSSSVARKHSLRGSLHSIPAIVEEEPEPKPEPQVDPEAEPEALIDAERHNCRLPIKIFGEEVVACILSVKVKCRERGLDHLCGAVKAACNLAREKRLEQLGDIMEDSNLSDESSDEESDSSDYKCIMFVKATLMMLQEAIMDSRELIIDKTIEIWQNLNAFCDDAVPQASVYGAIERAFSGLLMRTNDSNPRIRQAASQLVITLSKKFAKPPHSLLSLYVGKPDRVIHNHKDARARIELVTSVTNELSVEKSEGSEGLVPVKDLADFCSTYLKHSHEDVRKGATDLVIEASKQVGYPAISKYFDKALRQSISSTVKAALEETNGKTNGKPASNGAVAELRALAAQANVPSEKKTTTTTRKTAADSAKRKPVTTKTTGRTTTGTTRKTTTTTGTRGGTSARSTTTTTNASSRNTTTASKPAETSEPAEPASSDPKNTCIFCEEVNPNFNEDTLVSHYYDDCPVLTSCPRCQTILEVSTLNDHAFTDCAKRHLVKQCTRCKQPIPVEQWLQHSLKKNCTAVSDPKETRCPFCLATINPPTEAGWKNHLLSGNGCPKNPRKLTKTTVQDTNTNRKTANSSNKSSLRKKK